MNNRLLIAVAILSIAFGTSIAWGTEAPTVDPVIPYTKSINIYDYNYLNLNGKNICQFTLFFDEAGLNPAGYSKQDTVSQPLLQKSFGTLLGDSPVFSNLDIFSQQLWVQVVCGGHKIGGLDKLQAVPYALFAASGTQGPQGLQGPAGPVGAQGPQGPAGPVGAQGPQGPAGPVGAQGLQGPAGPVGAQGLQGPTGATGPRGPGDWLGAWDGATTYKQYDMIFYNGSSYISKQDANTGNTPGGANPDPFWSMVAQKGDIGAQGPAGPAGAQGPAGPAGAQGPAGPAGAQGPVGPAGAQGLQGPAGPIGATGNQGMSGAQFATVATSQSTTSSSYTDLGTTGPSATSVVVPASGNVLVTLTAYISTTGVTDVGYMGFTAVPADPANPTVSPGDNKALVVGAGGTQVNQTSATFVVTGLTGGATYTFTAKYRSTGGSLQPTTFANRSITVIPLP
jgi:hypothetical protein